MLNFYFTYGISEDYPYRGGWTTVTAPDYKKAIDVFRLYHPDIRDGVLNCADYYCETEAEFHELFGGENHGAAEHEHIYYAYVEKPVKVETNIFDEETTYPDCTVQILRNSITGEESVGWRNNRNEKIGGKIT